MEREVPLRITVVHPLSGVTLRLQRGRDGLVEPTQASEERVSFDFNLRVISDRADGGTPNLRGVFAQGPPASRFVYINSGTSAGQADSCWTRRAKVPLAGITWELVEQVLASGSAVLEACFEGTARDGGPACATVPLLEGGWKVSN
ncbi:MAG TPA: DUF5990 family protein [Thermoanaerobaculia bacterium]|nr:DUF5990 family protein [Thermoanaerobaculia bacterium]